MKRPILNQIDFPKDLFTKPNFVVTMSKNQWDTVLKVAYGQEAYLLELDNRENPIAVYKKP